jgi:hypothetical protein
MASIEWSNLRIPKALHERLMKVAADMLLAHQEGRVPLPSEHVERVPLYAVIERALDEREGHQERARRQARRNKGTTLKAPQTEGMYTSQNQEQENHQ